MDAGGWVMDAGTRPISRVGRRNVRCGSAQCLVVARQDPGSGRFGSVRFYSLETDFPGSGSGRFRFQTLPVPAGSRKNKKIKNNLNLTSQRWMIGDACCVMLYA